MRYRFTDYDISPYTGLTRDSWIALGEEILEGIFSSVGDIDQPMIVPRQEFDVTYPHLSAPPKVIEKEHKAEVFEGLARSFLLASVLLAENPQLKCNQISVADYYTKHILRSCTDKSSPEYVGLYQDMMTLEENADCVPFKPFQQTVETCALVIGLWAAGEVIWNRFSGEEKDAIAAFLLDWAIANTVPQNWRLFNMMDLAFLYMKGYEIPKTVMREHAQAILGFYAGDGWYRDGHSFDYYSCWAFNFYAPLWNQWYGYDNEPYIAQCFENNSNKLMETFPHMFDKDAFVTMWGRSAIYRNAPTCALDANLFLKNHTIDPGYARRICSGAIRQFYDRDDVVQHGIPTMGFYSQFTPLVQTYSCTESVFWSYKTFLCLHLPSEHPFWTDTENEGGWNQEKRETDSFGVCEDVLDGPGLCITNHLKNGATIIRSGKVNKKTDDLEGIWNYGKLCYNSKFPWEAGDENGDVQSCQYVIHNERENLHELANLTLWGGSRAGVLYRRQYFRYRQEEECHWMQAINLADFPVEDGIIRADRLRLVKKPVTITLGALGFPDRGTTIAKQEREGAQAIVLKGTDAMRRPRQLAMTIYFGWDEIMYKESEGRNPESEKSVLVYAKSRQSKPYSSEEPYFLISQVLTRNTDEPFTEDDIFRIKDIRFEDKEKVGAYGDLLLTLRSGETRRISFDEMEGRLMI